MLFYDSFWNSPREYGHDARSHEPIILSHPSDEHLSHDHILADMLHEAKLLT